jgi:hypothetical protein
MKCGIRDITAEVIRSGAPDVCAETKGSLPGRIFAAPGGKRFEPGLSPGLVSGVNGGWTVQRREYLYGTRIVAGTGATPRNAGSKADCPESGSRPIL